MTSKFTLFIILLFVAGLTATAQTSLHGKVVNGDNKPVEFATIMLLNATDSVLVKGAISDSAGTYTLPKIAPGNYLLTASMMGHDKSWAGPVVVAAETSQPLPPLKLQEAVEQLKAVTVVGQKPLIEQQAGKMVVNVEGSILATGGTALEVLEKSPGVTVDQNGNISLNGKQGVTVMLDGKRTYLSSADIANMLKNMPSDALELVELITNPSAKFDAAGNSGIINIKTKKGKNNGTNGSLTLGAGYGRFEKANVGLTLNHRQNNINYFGNYNYGHNRNFQNLSIDRQARFNDETHFFNQRNYMPGYWRGHSYKAGVDYFVNKNNTLGFMINGSIGAWGSSNDNLTLQSIIGVGNKARITTLGDTEESSQNTTLNFNYQRTFAKAGEELTFDIDYSNYVGRNYNFLDNNYSFYDNKPDSVFLLRSESPSEIDIWVAKLDYTLPIGKGKLETGAKFSYVNSDNDARIEKQEDAEASWENWDKFTNDFLYQENINAAYINWSGTFGKTSVMGGLRAEHTWYSGKSVKNDSTAANEYISLFPSVFVQHPLSKNHVMGVSYSRRVDRPSYQDLNPFFFLVDVTTYAKGNPLLLPQFTHQVQLSHTFKQEIVSNLSYSITDGPMTEIIETEGLDAFQTNRNLGTLKNWSLNVSVPVAITKWWQLQNNLSVFHNKYEGEYLGQNLDMQQLSSNFHMLNNIKLPSNLGLEFSGFYRSPILWGTMKIQSMWGIAAGARYSFWDNKASVKLSANDILNTMKFKGESIFGENKLIIDNRWESRRVNLSFSYRFGSKNAKPVGRKRGASSDEQDRIKSSGS